MTKRTRLLQMVYCIIAAAVLCIPQSAFASGSDYELVKIIRGSSVVVEGIVTDQSQSVDKDIPGHVGQTDSSVIIGWGNSIVSYFTPTRILKGYLKPNTAIKVHSRDYGTNDTRTLRKGREYILVLKPHRFKSGYIIADDEKAEWMIFNYGNERKLKSWYQDSSYRQQKDYLNYNDFIVKISNIIDPVRAIKDIEEVAVSIDFKEKP